MDDSGLLRGGALVLKELLVAPLFLPPSAHRVALRRTAGGGLPPLPVVLLPRPRPRMVPVLFLLVEDAPMVGRGGVPLAVPTADRLRIDATVAADNGRRGGVPPAALVPAVPEGEIENRDEPPYEPDDDNRLRLPAVVAGPPSYDPRLPILPRLPKLPEDDRPRPP